MKNYSSEINSLYRILKGYRPFRKGLGYFGWTGLSNLGDEALFEAVRQLLIPINVHNHPRFYGKGKIFQELLENHFYSGMLLGAGTLINSAGYLTEVQRLLSKNLRLFVFGGGVLEPEFQSTIAQSGNHLKEWVTALHEFEYVSVRGPLSRGILNEYGYKNADIVGDPAIYFAQQSIVEKQGTNIIGINIGTTSNGKSLWGGSDENVSNFAIRLCRVLRDKKYRIRIFSVWESDRACINKLASALSGDLEVEFIHESHDQFFSKLQDVDVFIGEKLHSVILALCTYTPSIMLAYAPKCEDFMSSISNMDYSVRTNQLDVPVLLDLIEKIYSDLPGQQKRIFSEMSARKNDLMTGAGKLIQKLNRAI